MGEVGGVSAGLWSSGFFVVVILWLFLIVVESGIDKNFDRLLKYLAFRDRTATSSDLFYVDAPVELSVRRTRSISSYFLFSAFFMLVRWWNCRYGGRGRFGVSSVSID
ncbi:hypothetical protein MANES_06G058100v8 [Manihot esculenta]|uniref:Uncharacterized protein n=1 Tax=Manihot esculenta TaxID=3983 RepID=A0A2C9VPR4_MANES|nr:hypothetical protein MANES_06G058100v8 [Manihot esculenta]